MSERPASREFDKGKSNHRGAKRPFIYGLLTILVSVVMTALLSEGVFRLLLFSDVNFMRKFRNPDLYFTYDSDDNYWKLYYLFQGKFGPPANPHPELGWVGQFARETYVHNQTAQVGARVPVLFYGDSFTECSTIPDKQQCFEGLLNNDTEFNRSHYLLNYGVGGYGLDQILILLRESLPRYDNPFVIIGIMTWDLDRSAHTVRIGQKPFFKVENGELVLKGVPVNQNSTEFFAKNPPVVDSYLLRLWAHGDGRLWRLRNMIKGLDGQYSSMAAINEKILEELIHELGGNKTPHLFVIFYPEWVYEDAADWREKLIKKVLDDHGEPYISTRELVFGDAGRLGKSPRSYYAEGHPTAYQYRLLAERIKQHVLTVNHPSREHFSKGIPRT